MTPKNRILIRRVDGPANADDIYRLQALCLPEDTPAVVEKGEWWLAYDGEDAIGFACLARSQSKPNHGYLARAGVAPSHRGLGLQKRLIRVRLARAKAHGWDGCVSDTRDNPASANSLIACGFRCYEPATAYGYDNTIYWRVAFAMPTSNQKE
jgi:GNAT superfamily N-acetyltransferase